MAVMGGQTKGVLLALGGALAFTPDALLVRLTATDAFTLASGRMLAAFLTILFGMIVFQGWRVTYGQFLALGRWGLAASLLQAFSSLLFCIAISNTSAANALLLFATTPLVSAFLAWLLLGQVISVRTWVAIGSALIAILIVSIGSLGSGGLLGDMLALANAVTTATFYILVQRHRSISFIPALSLGCLIGGLLAMPLADLTTLQTGQVGWLMAGGILVLPVAIAAFTAAIRYIPAAEVSLISLLEVVLGPLLVLAVLGEAIAPATMAGGAILLVTLAAHITLSLRDDPQSGPADRGLPVTSTSSAS